MVERQEKLLQILKWFHSFCIEHELRYYALGGTMLGTVRHKGFIPWDDDIDVGMPRADYEEFIRLCKDKVFGNYSIETVDTHNMDYYYGYAKIYDRSTTLIEKARVNVKRGIYVDLFPLDGVCNERDEINKIFKPIYYRYQLLVARTCAINSRRSFYKNVIVCFARLIPGIDNKKLLLKVDNLCKRRDYDQYKIVGNLLGNWGIKEIMSKEIIGTPTLYEFEDTEIYGVEKYDEYLTHLYGDWKKLPPKEKRESAHDYVEMDLHKSYLS